VPKQLSDHIADRILIWYAHHQRDLPWRKTNDPYCIWVSEVMLQQTQVETVIPYYHRFLARFPTVQALAAASLDEVLKAWENMGYYARARNLHAAAREIMKRLGGKIPNTREELISLSGIGSYTAGAILSSAFQLRVPAVDGNVRRVVSRLFAIKEPMNKSQTQQRVWELAEGLVPMKTPGHFNQALMDLGATICIPRKPACTLCPIQEFCQSYKCQSQNALPVTRARRPIPHKHVTAGVILDDHGRVLIVQRPNQGLLGGLWKFPGGNQQPGEALETCLRRKIHEELCIEIVTGKRITSVDHAYTHFRITLHAFHCTHQAGEPQALGCADWRWVTCHELNDFAFSKADRQVIQAGLSTGQKSARD